MSFTDGTFDPLVAISYAAQHAFSPVQVYLDNRLVMNRIVRKNVLTTARKCSVPIMLHAPCLLRLPEATEASVIRAARELLTVELPPRVVYHFDETRPVEESLAATAAVFDMGIVPCVENFHQRGGAANARRNYAEYLELFSRIRGLAVPAIPVIDVPRVYHTKLRLTNEAAFAVIVEVLRSIGSMEFPVLLHLIDSTSRRQARCDWCPVGEGIIPYTRIFRGVAGVVRFDDVVLEFEDRDNPIPSREYLYSLASM